MKKILILTAAVLLIAAMTACGAGKNTAETAAPTEAPRQASYLDTRLDEPEWTLAEGDLQLGDGNTVYAEKSDILYFAIVTNKDGSQELRFKLSDATAAKLKTLSPDTAYTISLNGEKIGTATLSEDATVATVTAQNAVGEITALATKISVLATE